MNSVSVVLKALIRAYQLILSPILPGSCRFYPSCSEYAHESVSRHGAARGSVLAVWRILRCHPWNEGGVDPVPTPVHAETRKDVAPGCHDHIR
ncbi:MAG: membrane protein insertion efficiency factor YidD [Rhodospirillales bacterium]|nr:membrane protein insertion efficiency factor YidD [Rhodospirillales bacterium]